MDDKIAPKLNQPRWKRSIKNIYLIFAFFALLAFPLLGALPIKAHDEGELQPTIEKSVP